MGKQRGERVGRRNTKKYACKKAWFFVYSEYEHERTH